MMEEISRIPVKIVLEGAGEAEAVITKISAPLTVEAVLKILPLDGRVYLSAGSACFLVGLKRGEEKSRRRVEAGTIAYWPMSDSVCVFYEDTSSYSPVNVIGKITKNLELFRGLSSGTKIRVERI
jgi:hypothetical protein